MEKRSKEFEALLGARPEDVDIPANAAAKERVLHAPLTEDERAAQRAYLSVVTERGNQSVSALDSRQLRVAVSLNALIEYGKSLEFLRNVDLDACGATDQERERHHANIRFCELAVARAHYALGDFESAVAECPLDAPELATFIKMFEAERKPDDEFCGCPKTTNSIASPQAPNGERYPLKIATNTQVSGGDFPNARRGCWVWLVVCTLCGHWNVVPDLPDTAARERLLTESPDDIHKLLARKER